MNLVYPLRANTILYDSPHTSYVKINPRKINHPWYFDDYGDNFSFEDVVEALRIWGENHDGAFNITDKYVIKSPEEVEYEERNMGLRKPMPSDKAGLEFEEMAFMEEEVDSMGFDNADNASVGFADDVMVDFRRPRIAWPPHLFGLELGSIVRRIREGDVEVMTDPDKKAALDSIGFDWGDEERFLDIPFEKAMCALFAYFQIRGDLFVYDDFIMPADEPWPRILEGFELGKIVFKIREKQHFFEKYYPEKKAMLDMLEFVWFPKYASKLTDFEEEHARWFGYPQPSREVLTYLFPNAEDYWDESNPPIFNFTAAKEFIESGGEDEEWEEDELDLEDEVEEEEEVRI